MSSNNNNKTTHDVYINSILNFVIKQWLNRKNDFVLKEDDDSNHDTRKTRNKMKTWKAKHNLNHYFNCAQSFDLSIIKNAWQSTKQHVRKFPHWNDFSLKELIVDGWERMSQEFINERVDQMPERLQAVINGKGAMTGYWLID